RHLSPSGLLVINIPSSRGIFYRLSKLFARFGVQMPFARMWQESLPSPHIHYFSPKNLSTLLLNSGFRPLAAGRLPSLELSGLRERINYASGSGAAVNALTLFGAGLILPALRVLPSDIMYIIAARVEETE